MFRLYRDISEGEESVGDTFKPGYYEQQESIKREYVFLSLRILSMVPGMLLLITGGKPISQYHMNLIQNFEG